MIDFIAIRVFKSGQFGTRLEVALAQTGELPRVMFRASVVLPALWDESSDVRDVLEGLGEELFNVAPYAKGRLEGDGPGALGEELNSSAQLSFPGEIDGGGRGGPAGDGSEAKPLLKE